MPATGGRSTPQAAFERPPVPVRASRFSLCFAGTDGADLGIADIDFTL